VQHTPRRAYAPGRRRLLESCRFAGRDCMTVRVLLFASWADALGSRAVDVDVADDASAGDVLFALEARGAGRSLPRPALAVNRCIVPLHARIAPGDEVAIIPPVAGG
jgi:molybdopterin converting factor small subunit